METLELSKGSAHRAWHQCITGFAIKLHLRSRYIDTLTIGFYNLQLKGKEENPHTH